MKRPYFLKDIKKEFNSICSANALALDFQPNKSEFQIFKNIFVDREYADYFPFYQSNCIIDAGAHYGYFSLFAAINSQLGSRIIAIEPSSTNLSQLKKNIDHNSHYCIEPLQKALTPRDGTVTLMEGRSVNHSLVANPLLQVTRSINVEGISLGSLIRMYNLEKVDFLKMDIEGGEYQVVKETPSEVFSKIQTISLEFHDLKDPRNNGNTLISPIIDLGYSIVKFHYEPTNLGLNYGKIIATRP